MSHFKKEVRAADIKIAQPEQKPDAAPAASRPMTLTQFSGPPNSRLTKAFSLDDDGNIDKDSTPNFSSGDANSVNINSLREIEPIIESLGTNQCIATGVFDVATCKIVTADGYRDMDDRSGFRTRTKQHMQQPAVGLALLDYDSSPFMPEQLRCDSPVALMAKVTTACPELQNVGYSSTGSASSGIYNKDTGEDCKGGGMHIYLAIENVDPEQFRRYLEARLWLADFGYIAFAKNGAMLTRTIVDTSVLSPERLIYEAPPVLGEGIGQKERTWAHRPGAVLKEIPALTDAEIARYEELVAEAKKHPDTVARAEALLDGHHAGRVKKLAAIKKIDFKEAEKQLPRPTLADLETSTQSLDLNDTVEIAGETMLVSELLKRGAEFDGRAMPDPIEGSAYGMTTAKFYFNDGNALCINSFAHGQKTVYMLKQHLPAQRKLEQPKSQLTESHAADLTKPLDPEGFPHKKSQQNGTIKLLPTIDNHAHLCRGYGITLGYNVMKKEPVITIPGFSGSIENYFSNTIETICSQAALNGMDTRQVPKYLNVLADRNPINPIAEWITSVPWDGVDRVEAISDTLVVHEDFPIAFKGKLVKKFLTSAVAAATLPSGFESRGILTIQGPQGIGKTSWARNLVPRGLLGDQYVLTGHHLDASSKDSIVAAITHWFVEIGEVDSSLKKNVALLKGFITQKHDSLRLWYGRAISKFQRRTVFIATVNDPNFLVDQTGNSRFWTLPVTKINYNHGIDMQQLYRQLYDETQQGAEWWLNSEGEAQLEELNQVHRAVNAVEERVMMAMNPNLPSGQWAAKKPIEVLLAIGFRNPSNRQCKDCADVLRREYGSPKKIQGAYRYRIPMDLSRVPNF